MNQNNKETNQNQPASAGQNDIAQAPPAQNNQEAEKTTAGGCLPRLVLPLVDVSNSEGFVSDSEAQLIFSEFATPEEEDQAAARFVNDALSIARFERPNDRLALVVWCGPLESLLSDKIPSRFVGRTKRRAHHAQSLATPDTNQSNANPDPQSQSSVPSVVSPSNPKELSESNLGE